jgi:hypothetical protein
MAWTRQQPRIQEPPKGLAKELAASFLAYAEEVFILVHGWQEKSLKGGVPHFHPPSGYRGTKGWKTRSHAVNSIKYWLYPNRGD